MRAATGSARRDRDPARACDAEEVAARAPPYSPAPPDAALRSAVPALWGRPARCLLRARSAGDVDHRPREQAKRAATQILGGPGVVRSQSSGRNYAVRLTPAQGAQLQAQAADRHDRAMHQLLIGSGLTLAGMSVHVPRSGVAGCGAGSATGADDQCGRPARSAPAAFTSVSA